MLVKLEFTPQGFKEILAALPTQYERARLANAAQLTGPITRDGQAEEYRAELTKIVNQGK